MQKVRFYGLIKFRSDWPILRTVLDLTESPKPLLAICWTIFSRFKSSPKFQKMPKKWQGFLRKAYRIAKKLSELLIFNGFE